MPGGAVAEVAAAGITDTTIAATEERDEDRTTAAGHVWQWCSFLPGRRGEHAERWGTQAERTRRHRRVSAMRRLGLSGGGRLRF